MNRAVLLWILAAAGGVVLVAGVTLAASRLSTQAIGLSSEPVSAGERLSPSAPDPTATPRATATARKPARRRPRATATAAPTAVPTPVPTVADDESGGDGSGRGRGRGRGGDDD